jgi:RNA polymerase sigma-70 factor (ECF subfamily)
MAGMQIAMGKDLGQERFAALLEEHQGILFKAANSYCRNAADREDLIQEIRVQLWRAFSAYDERRPFSTWMYRIALNVAISFARRTRQRERFTVPLDTSEAERIVADAAQEPDERLEALYRILNSLDELNRALLLLYLDDYSYREIAEILGITETNVATKISRLKQQIRKNAAPTDKG